MSIYSKIAKISQEMNGLQKSGKNDFAKFKYFELSDFLPKIIEKEYENKIMTRFILSETHIKILCVDLANENNENNEEITVFEAPRGADETTGKITGIQQYGAMLTYYRRYAYMCLYNIIESDQVHPQKNEKDIHPKKSFLNESQKTAEWTKWMIDHFDGNKQKAFEWFKNNIKRELPFDEKEAIFETYKSANGGQNVEGN